MLEKLRAEFTRSRPRRRNDNALVESKNASVVRRHLGREHIRARFAPQVHQFASAVLSPHLNFHRPCRFATALADANGKLRKVYRDRDAPYERLKSLDGAERFHRNHYHWGHPGTGARCLKQTPTHPFETAPFRLISVLE